MNPEHRCPARPLQHRPAQPGPVRRPWRNNRARQRQNGVTMLFGLFALAIMMLGAAAMVRSMNTSMVMSGNLGFKRDLTNQAERAADAVMGLLTTGALSSETARSQHLQASNYSATMLPTNPQGIPLVLVNDSQFSGAGVSSNDITVAEQGVVLRYVLDRLCLNTSLADASHCQMSESGAPMGGNASGGPGAEDSAASGGGGALPLQTVYRLSIRVNGPRNTQAYFQTTFAL
jgi:type IV pilus assembly protein PilX